MDHPSGKFPVALYDQTGFLITDIGRRYRIMIDRRMKSVGLTRSQWWLISFLHYFNGSTQQQLADIMDTGKAGVAKLLDRMEEKGLIHRVSDPLDGRSKRVHLADQIKPLASEIEAGLDEVTAQSLRALTADEAAQLNRLLNKVRQTQIDDQGPPAA
jgi:DNA-binding MarR family transcriptional regulator